MRDGQAESGKPAGAPRVAAWFVPPDFVPERVIDAQTWGEAVFEPIMLIAAAVCFMVGLIQFGLALFPTWPTNLLATLNAVVGIEAFLYSRRLVHPSFRPKEWLVLLTPVLVVERGISYLTDSNAATTSVVGWLKSPLSFFTLGFIVNVVVLLITWIIVFTATQYLNQLRVQYGEIASQTEAPGRDRFDDNWRAFDHSAPLRQLGQIFVAGGVILVIMSSLASIGTSQFLSIDALTEIVGFQRPSLHLIQANVIAYFLCGLALLGECHFVRQRTLWRLDRITIPSNVSSRWVVSLGGLIALATAVAFLLPTSYAMTVGEIVSLVAGLFVRLGLFIVAGVFYIMFLLSRLIPVGGSKDGPTPPTAPPRLPSVAPPPSGASPFDLAQSLLFWVVVLAIVGYSLYVGWRRRPSWLALSGVDALLSGIWRAFTNFLRLGRRAGEQVIRAIASVPLRWRQPKVAVPSGFRYIALGRLGPQQLIEYFYLSICERAAQLGHPRPPGVTPAEFQVTVRQELPVVDPEITALTEAFVRARYGPEATSSAHVADIRPTWQVLKQKLRQARVRRITNR